MLQPRYSIEVISLETADDIANAVLAKAQSMNLLISVAVVSRDGSLKCLKSMDGAMPVSVDVAIKKAQSALAFLSNTGEHWNQYMKQDEILKEGLLQLPQFAMLSGGICLKNQKNQVVATIGVSGAHHLQDLECAKAGEEVWFDLVEIMKVI